MDVSPDYSSITYRKNQAAIKFYHELSLDENDHDAALGDYLATDISIPNLQSSPVSISTKVPEVLECMNATSTLIDCEDKESERASMHSPKDSDFDFEVMSISGESCMDIAQSSTDACLPFPWQQSHKIRSVVNHIGNTANCGHYTADAYRKLCAACTYLGSGKSSDSEGRVHSGVVRMKRNWNRFNDSFVSQLDKVDKAMGDKSQQMAYMITYELEQPRR